MAYLSLRTRKFSNCLQINPTSSRFSNRFRLKSSSTIKGQVFAMLSFSSSAFLIRMPSTMTIFSSWSCASCCLILSKPTSSTTFPEISICWSRATAIGLSVSSEAYFCFTASRNVRSESDFLVERMNDPALGEGLKPTKLS